MIASTFCLLLTIEGQSLDVLSSSSSKEHLKAMKDIHQNCQIGIDHKHGQILSTMQRSMVLSMYHCIQWFSMGPTILQVKKTCKTFFETIIGSASKR